MNTVITSLSGSAMRILTKNPGDRCAGNPDWAIVGASLS